MGRVAHRAAKNLRNNRNPIRGLVAGIDLLGCAFCAIGSPAAVVSSARRTAQLAARKISEPRFAA